MNDKAGEYDKMLFCEGKHFKTSAIIYIEADAHFVVGKKFVVVFANGKRMSVEIKDEELSLEIATSILSQFGIPAHDLNPLTRLLDVKIKEKASALERMQATEDARRVEGNST